MGLKIHELPADPGRQQTPRRVGRGESSGWGKTCGKGHKGQQARAGSGKGPGFEGGQTPLIRRIPKFGFSNVSFRKQRAEVRLGALNRFEDGAVVDLEALRQARLIKKSDEFVKVIATGELERKLTVKVHGFTQGARSAIEARGGSCEVVPA